jgi:hypothetical protein
MNRTTRNPNGNDTSYIKPPAYPFTGGILWTDLHTALSAEQGTELPRPFLAQIIGEATNNVYSWFNAGRHKELLAFMCLLERLSATARQAFIEAHCRVCPTLNHKRFFYPKGMRERASALITKGAGITLITGGSLSSFALSALGHSFVLHSGAPAAGLDIHRPVKLAPVTGVLHLDETLDRRQLRRLVFRAWPRIQVSRSRMLILNGVLSRVPELRRDVFRLARHKHVVITDAEEIQVDGLSGQIDKPLDVVTVSVSRRKKEGIRVICQR